MSLDWLPLTTNTCPVCGKYPYYAYFDKSMDYFLLRHAGHTTRRSTLPGPGGSPAEWTQWVGLAHSLPPPPPLNPEIEAYFRSFA